MNLNKTWLAWTVTITVVTVMSVGSYWLATRSLIDNPSNEAVQTAVIKPEQQPATTITPTTPRTSIITAGTDTLTDNGLTYQEAVNAYDYRFQFDNGCHAIVGLPSFGTINVKQGSAILLENHSTTSHRLALGNNAATVGAGEFVILTAPRVSQPTGLYVTCDGKGAGRLYVYP